jgi:epoxide hydrolase
VTEPFRIHVSDEAVEDLTRRVRATRLGLPPAGEAWDSGVDYGYLKHLLEYWGDGFDWRAREGWLNTFPQFIVDIDRQKVHFVHVTADRERYETAIPIVLSHGWPYSFVEFLSIVAWLTDPKSHGGDRAVAFDVVIPSLPGYGYSDPLTGDYFTGDVVARLWHRLMTETLGYRRYATYGEDVGTTVSDWIGASYPDHVLGLFATHAAFPPEGRSTNLSEDEERFRSWLAEKWAHGAGYSLIQATRPDTLAVALGDSPAGLLAWLVEKFREWSGPEFDTQWSGDDILTTVSLYWFTGTIGTSFLPYYHARHHDKPVPMVDVPVGVAVQRGESGFPREYAERTYTDIRTWSELPRGGHFTAKQTPDLVARAIWELFSMLGAGS